MYFVVTRDRFRAEILKKVPAPPHLLRERGRFYARPISELLPRIGRREQCPAIVLRVPCHQALDAQTIGALWSGVQPVERSHASLRLVAVPEEQLHHYEGKRARKHF